MNLRVLRISIGIFLVVAFGIGLMKTAQHHTTACVPAVSLEQCREKLQALVITFRDRGRVCLISIASFFQPHRAVTVGGFVRQPGPVAFSHGMTIWQAIQGAGGATEFGSLRRVKILRDGKAKIYDATKAKFMAVTLEANDTIEVPQKVTWGS